MTSIEPVKVMAEIQADVRALDAAGQRLGVAIKERAEAELSYEDAFEAELRELVKEANGDRLPGEDVRRALIHGRIDAELRGRFHRLNAEVVALEKWSRLRERTLNGRQTILSGLKAEMAGAP